MCLAIPMRLLSRDGDSGVVELRGVRRQVSLLLLPHARAGDHLLIHAGFAIGTVDEQAAAETMQLLREWMAADESAAATEADRDLRPPPRSVPGEGRDAR